MKATITKTTTALPLTMLACIAAVLFAAPAASAEGTVNGNVALLSGSTTDANGLNQTTLPGIPGTIDATEFSPDGTRLAVASRDLAGKGALYVSAADGTGRERVTPKGAAIRVVHWTPDGTKLIFLSDRDDSGGAELYSVGVDGTGEVQLAADATDLTTPSDDGSDPIESPSFSVAGNHIAYATAAAEGDCEIVVMNLDGTGRVQLTDDADQDLQPNLTPDGSTVVFTKVTGEKPQIMRIGADGTGLTGVTPAGADASNPHLSPDGTRVAYNEDAGSYGPIRVINLDGTGDEEILSQARSGYVTAVSPDGERVAYDFVNFGGEGYFTINAFSLAIDGGGRRRFANGNFGDWQALDSPAPKPGLDITAEPGRVNANFIPQARVTCSNECAVKLVVSGRLGNRRVDTRVRDMLVGGRSGRVNAIDDRSFHKKYKGLKGTLTVKVIATDDYGQKAKAKTKLKIS